MTDHLLRDRNTRLYREQRGRRCQICGAKVRYTKELPFCDICEPRDYYDVDPTSRTGFTTPSWDHRRPPKEGRGPKHGLVLTRLRELRRKKYRYAATLAAEVGMAKSAYTRLERCQGGARPETAERIAGALGVGVAELMGELP